MDKITLLYGGRFALDFLYDEWARPARESMHTRYVEVVERSVTSDMRSGHFGRAITIAGRALEVDPSLDEMEKNLVKLYQLSGAHRAAAEQYAHYAETMRELGLEVPPLDLL